MMIAHYQRQTIVIVGLLSIAITFLSFTDSSSAGRQLTTAEMSEIVAGASDSCWKTGTSCTTCVEIVGGI